MTNNNSPDKQSMLELRTILKKLEKVERLLEDRFPSAPISPSLEPQVSEAVFDRMVRECIFNPNRLGKRPFEKILESARQANVLKGKRYSSTPSTKIGIVALLKEASVDLKQGEIIDEYAEHMVGELQNLSKIVRNNTLSNTAIPCKKWASIKNNYKLFYCLQLESIADSQGIPIYRCINQWAANLVMTKIMRNRTDSDAKRKRRLNKIQKHTKI